MKAVINDLKCYLSECKQQNFAFFSVVAYLIFSYLRPQVIYPFLNIIPWTEISIIAGLIYIIAKGKIRLQTTHFLLLIFALVITASAFQSQYPDVSIKKLNVIYIWLVEVIFFTNCIYTIRQYYLVTITLFIILFKMSLFGARTWVERGFGFRGWGIAGPDGFFANSGEFSLLMAILAILSIAFIFALPSKRKIYYLLPITAIMTVLGASSRGGQLALAVGLLLFVMLIVKLRPKNIFIFLLMSFLVITLLPDKQKERFSSMGEDDTSVSRILYWEKGFDMMNKYSLLGVGFYAFPPYFHDHYSNSIYSSASVFKREEVAHNSFIEVGAGIGYLGLACYLWIIFHCYRLNKRTQKMLLNLDREISFSWATKYAVGINISLITYLIGSFFMSVAFYPYIFILLMLSQTLNNSVSTALKNS